jgi:CRP/FNR family transcriptional regulator, cyclic AMP receptor protein
MPDMLTLSAELPEVILAPEDVLVLEGNTSGPIWVLVEGDLAVSKGGVGVNTINRPGAVIGEVSVLLGTTHGATVTASTPALLRKAEDGAAFLVSDPIVVRLVAEGLARRLSIVTTYLADLKDQYGDAPGLSMVSEVLSTLSQHGQPSARPGSARDPDPAY